MWTTPLDLLERRFPGSSALAATTILGAVPPCVVVHARVLELLEDHGDSLPLAQRLREAVPGPDADVTVLVQVEPLLRRLGWLLDELVDHPRRARRLTRRLEAVVCALETCSTSRPRTAACRAPRVRSASARDAWPRDAWARDACAAASTRRPPFTPASSSRPSVVTMRTSPAGRAPR